MTAEPATSQFPPDVLARAISEATAAPAAIRRLLEDLPQNLKLRPLLSTDYSRGFPHVLSSLTLLGSQTRATFLERFTYLRLHNHAYRLLVVEDVIKDAIIGAATLLVERKFIRGNGMVGHIEDVVVDPGYRGHKLGQLLILGLLAMGQHTKCYKVILDCAEKNVKFYEKCGLRRKEVSMAWYIDGDRAAGKPVEVAHVEARL